MIVRRAAVDAGLLAAVRAHVLTAIDRIAEAPEQDRDVWALQSGIGLGSIECPALLVLAAELGRSCGLPCGLDRSSVRLQACSGARQLRWHQDYAPMRLTPGQAGMVAWVPLDPIDGTRPTLEVAPEVAPRLHETDERAFLVIPSRLFSGTVLTGLAVGDVVWFDPYEPHRTYVTDGMTLPRLSLDMRFAEGW